MATYFDNRDLEAHVVGPDGYVPGSYDYFAQVTPNEPQYLPSDILKHERVFGRQPRHRPRAQRLY